ncbi:DNA primase [Frigoriglobus tundricola]|uniref:DNA primase, phage associated n=1 Tax=Frigoriglobus tundricola TaxID=2774151 RepID=A0A6M5YF08_9BACT|nr:DNA primase [Frigoriglobus tundricola]QJW92558.1 DNA primase, phage associated [Frigoriglobus tundricola]
MPDLTLDSSADDPKLLAQIVAYYHQTLKESPDALAYLRKRGITNPAVIDHFRVGYSDRTLGLKLPIKARTAGAVIRERLHRLGLYRESGHEHFHGSVIFPVAAADGTGRIVDIYGRKTRTDLRAGTPLDTHLNNDKLGVWNVEAFAGAAEVVLCSSLFDALTFWNHGCRNATTMFGTNALTDDLLAAFKEFNVRRVLTTDEKVVEKLLVAGLEVFLVRLPLDTDVNAYARQTKDPADALGSLLRGAEWAGKGKPTSAPVVACTAAPEAQNESLSELLGDDPDEEDESEPGEGTDHETNPPVLVIEEQAPIRTASPVPPAPQADEATVSENQVVLTFGTRKYRVRGLEKNATPDVLKANVLATNGVGMFIDTFDLYSAKHRTGFQAQAAAEMNVEEATVKADIGRVLLKLEELQDARLRRNEPTTPVPSQMTAADQNDALALLRDPHLLDRIVNDFAVVGDRTNKLVGYLAAVSRKLDQPLAVLIQSTSAAGKTTLMEAVLNFCPPEDVVKYSAMTGQSLYYIGDGGLRHKILAIVEEEGAAKASYALKLLQSEGELRIASTGKEGNTGRLTTQEYHVAGPTMLFLTTTGITTDEELLNRCLVLTVQEDREQTRAIHDLQRKRQTLDGLLAANSHQSTLTLHRNAQRLLKPLLVVNPFAERLTFPTTRTRTRRDHQKYLTLIRTITLLHQHQRPVRTVEHNGKAVEFIEATVEDIAAANALASVVLGRCLDDLPPQTRNLLGLLDAFVTEQCRVQSVERADFRFSRRQVREATAWGDTQLKLHLKRLVELEFVGVHRDRQTNRHAYELLFACNDAGHVLPELLNVAELRRAEVGCEPSRSGSEPNQAVVGRGLVGPMSGLCRAEEIDATTVSIGNTGQTNRIESES